MPSSKTAPPKTLKAPAGRATAKRAATKVAPTAAQPAPKSASRPAVTSAPVLAKPPKQKQKLVRDSFAMPVADFDLIDTLKERALTFRRPAKKSELLRAGLHSLTALTDAQLRAALDSLAPLKPGRPKKAA